MCGRFTQTKSREDVLEALGGIELPPLFHGRYNIAPTQKVAIIRSGQPDRADECIWGFANPKSASPVINARSETLAERPMFKDLLANNRCLIPADGFYEWKGRQPYFFQLLEKQLFAFAGLWRDDRCVILTRADDANMRGIHHRMPVILPSNYWKTWLAQPHERQSRLSIDNLDCTFCPPPLTARPVSRRVNKVANDDPACLDPADEQIDLSLFPDAE
jgi:putative SOS response-associated peptidase YedK